MRRVVLITQGLTRVVEPIINSEHEVIAVIDAPPRAPKKKKKPSRIGVFLKPFFIMLGVRKPSLEKYCASHSIRYLSMAQLSDNEISDFLRKEHVDILVVYSMSSLLREEVFAAPKYGAINLHPSYLPQYPGPNPWFWRYLNQDERGGVTVHCIDAGEDTGDILLQQYYTVEKGIKSPNLQDIAIGDIGSRLLLQVIDQIDELPRVKQNNHVSVQRARNVKKTEHRFIIDWKEWPIQDIWHLLRGTELWLDAIEQPSGLFRGMRWSVQSFASSPILDEPFGNVTHVNRRACVVCRDGVIFLKVRFVLSIFLRNLLGSR
ncbi:hypothetical protein A3765_13575 [Oleiphilus sp. HI0130]|nr:hypothetical protein A3765_13575 [Oleiphilus sp. HI0130]